MSDRDQEASSPRAEAIIIQQQQTDEDQHHHHHHHAGEQTDQDALSPPTTLPPLPPPPPPPPPPLEPFFTLVTNTTTGSTTHPRVRYLFSDDDPSSVLPPEPADRDHGSSSSSSTTTRPLIVDLVPAPDNAGWSVSWASSLSPDFALTGSSITVQHDGSHAAGAGAGAGDDKSTTLRLEGVERDPPDASSRPCSLPSSGSGPALGRDREDVDSLADEFRRRMGVLRKVVGGSEKRRFITGAQTGSSPRKREREQHQGPQRQPQPQPEDDVAVEGGESPGEKDAVRDSIRAEHAEAAGSTWG